MNTIGEKIYRHRMARKWPRRKLAEKIAYTEASVFRWERGDYKPSERAIRALEKAFGEKLRR